MQGIWVQAHRLRGPEALAVDVQAGFKRFCLLGLKAGCVVSVDHS